MNGTVRSAREDPRPIVGVVGPCAAGKSALVAALRAHGLNAREIGQEHSHVPDMWQRLTQPDVLVYLDVSWEAAQRRRPSDVDAGWWAELSHRLRHARKGADIYVRTDEMSEDQVAQTVIDALPAYLALASSQARE